MVRTPIRGSGTSAVDTGRSYLRPFGRRRHRITRPGLRNLARARSEAVAELVRRREACRPRNDAIIKDHEYPHRRVTLHDVETLGIYLADHHAAVSDLRELFAARGIRSQPLDRYLAAPENGADLRTISTALLEMAARLEK